MMALPMHFPKLITGEAIDNWVEGSEAHSAAALRSQQPTGSRCCNVTGSNPCSWNGILGLLSAEQYIGVNQVLSTPPSSRRSLAVLLPT